MIACLMAILTSGCVATYRLPEGDAHARLDLSREWDSVTTFICISGEHQKLRTDSEGFVQIPTGKRVTFESFFYQDNGLTTASCSNTVSIIPEPGQSYLIDLEVADQGCVANIYREGAANRTGLALEPSAVRFAACRRR